MSSPLDDESLPRDNGELVFEAPWQARALAIAVVLVDKLGLSLGRLSATADGRDRQGPAAALLRKLERRTGINGRGFRLTTSAALDAAAPTEREPL